MPDQNHRSPEDFRATVIPHSTENNLPWYYICPSRSPKKNTRMKPEGRAFAESTPKHIHCHTALFSLKPAPPRARANAKHFGEGLCERLNSRESIDSESSHRSASLTKSSQPSRCDILPSHTLRLIQLIEIDSIPKEKCMDARTKSRGRRFT